MMPDRKDPHDDQTPAKATRAGRQKGVRVFIPAAALKEAFTRKQRAGALVYDIPEELYYRVKPWGKKSVVLRFGGEGEL